MPKSRSVRRKLFRAKSASRSKRGGMFSGKKVPAFHKGKLVKKVNPECECCATWEDELDCDALYQGDMLYHPARIIDGRQNHDDGSSEFLVEFDKDEDDIDPDIAEIVELYRNVRLSEHPPTPPPPPKSKLRQWTPDNFVFHALKFTAMDKAARTANEDELEAIRLAKLIMRNSTGFKFTSYLKLNTSDDMWIVELNELEKKRVSGIVDMRVKMSPLELWMNPLQRAQQRVSCAKPLPSMLSSTRMRAVQGMPRHLIEKLHAHPTLLPSTRGPEYTAKRELSGCAVILDREQIAAHDAQHAKHAKCIAAMESSPMRSPCPIIDPLLPTRTIDLYMAQPDVYPDMAMLFHTPVVQESSPVCGGMGRCGNCLVRALCETLMPSDIVVAVARHYENYELIPRRFSSDWWS